MREKKKMVHITLTETEAKAINRCLILFATIKLHVDANFSNLPGFKDFDAFTQLSRKFKPVEELPQPQSKDEAILKFYESDFRGQLN